MILSVKIESSEFCQQEKRLLQMGMRQSWRAGLDCKSSVYD